MLWIRPLRASIARRFALTGFIVCAACVTAASAPAQDHPRLAPYIARRAQINPQSTIIAWVYFTDRAGAERRAESFGAARALISERALERRARRGIVRGINASDLPVHEPYVRVLTARGATLRGTSRWLNAASVELPAGVLAELSHLPFVARVEPVAAGLPLRPVGAPEPAEGATNEAPSHVAHPTRVFSAPGDTAYYGGAFKQLSMMQVPQLHAAGLSGAGVLVCILDGGFRTTHRALQNVNVIARRDFVNGDNVVDDEPGDVPGEASHGTQTTACVAGTLPGTYSGVAFGAAVALGKTEYGPTETPVEMDQWQFGAEWADSMGADVISSSLGYFQFDSPFPSYTQADMDGRTTVVTMAAVEAMRRGITVVNSAGNENGTEWQKIIAPADADTVIAVGAVDSLNVVATFSSLGPSADGRIKPDVTAMGRRVLVPSFSNDSTYVRVNGTSFSCPLTAGLVALLLEAHPAWGPYEVREALRTTALNSAAPDTVIGWGLVQGLLASQWAPNVDVPVAAMPRQLALAAGPNPLRSGGGLTVRFSAPEGEPVTVDLIDLSGRRVCELYRGPASTERAVRWNGRDADGHAARAGIYFVRIRTERESRGLRIALLGS